MVGKTLGRCGWKGVVTGRCVSKYSRPLLFGVDTVLWPRAAQKRRNWHRGVVDEADRFMARWHRGEAEQSWLRLTAEDAKSSNQGKPWGSSRIDTARDECRK